MDWSVIGTFVAIIGGLSFLWLKEQWKVNELQQKLIQQQKELNNKNNNNNNTNNNNNNNSNMSDEDRKVMKTSSSDFQEIMTPEKITELKRNLEETQWQLQATLRDKAKLQDKVARLEKSSFDSHYSSNVRQDSHDRLEELMKKSAVTSITNKSDDTKEPSSVSGTFRKKGGDNNEVEDESDYSSVRIKREDTSRSKAEREVPEPEGDDQTYSSVRVKSSFNEKSDNVSTTSSSFESSFSSKSPQFREPEVWEQNLVALGQNKWGPGMKDENFKKYGPRHRPRLPSVFMRVEDEVSQSLGFHPELLKQPNAERALLSKFVRNDNPASQPDEGFWTQPQEVVVQIKKRPSHDGALRNVYDVTVLNEPKDQFVIKSAKSVEHAKREIFERDVRMQSFCQQWADEFNSKNPPKRISYVDAWLVDLPDRTHKEPMILERKLDGTFLKYNDNQGLILEKRSTPQAFSHFSYELSEHKMVICDIQGVGDSYTDPQVHSLDRKLFGLGDLGSIGIDRFVATHHCNPVCKYLQLPDLHPKDAPTPISTFGPTLPFPSEFIEKQKSLPKTNLKSLAKPSFTVEKEYKSKNRLMCLVLDPRVARLFVGSHDGSILVFQSISIEEPLETVKKHVGSVNTLCCDPEGKYLFSGSSDSDIRIWELPSDPTSPLRSKDKKLDGHLEDINALVASSDKLCSASRDKTIRVFKIGGDWKCEATLSGHEKSVQVLAFTSDSQHLLSSGLDGIIKLWDLNSYSCIFNLQAHTTWCKSLSVIGNFLFSGSHDQKVILWDLSKLELVKTVDESSKVRAVLANDKVLLVGADDLSVYSLPDMEHTQTLKQKLSVDAMAFADANQRKVFGVVSEHLYLWNSS